MEFKELLPSDLDERQMNFGKSIFIYNEYAIIGSGLLPTDGNPQDGCAYIFKYSDGGWHQTCQLNPPPGDELDYAGWNVCMTDEFAIMSSFNAQSLHDQFTGKAYIFKNTGDGIFELMTVLHPLDNISSSQYGHSVAISGDIAVVGAPYNVIDGVSAAGSVYVYFREGDNWIQRHKLVGDSSSQADFFGNSICLSGKKLIVAVPGAKVLANENQGVVYYFHFKGLGLTRELKIIAPDGAANDSFGSSVNIKGDRIIIGAPGKQIMGRLQQGRAYTFSVVNDELRYLGRLTASDGNALDRFGDKVSVSNNIAIVSIPMKRTGGISTHGKVYVYQRFFLWWIRIATIVDPNPGESLSKIHAVSLSIFGGIRFIGIGNREFNDLKGKVIIAES